MALNEDSSQYEVGFRKPPKNTRFRKGQSGNPQGRPKGSRNLASVLERTLRERVVINENGTRRVVTKLEAAVKQLVNKAASGDLAAMRQLSCLANSAEIEAIGDQNKSTLEEADYQIMNRLLKKLKESNTDKKEGINE
ncbi:MAG: DUF5681 domain-containing protein [Candidatus Acidiferrales bacterium]